MCSLILMHLRGSDIKHTYLSSSLGNSWLCSPQQCLYMVLEGEGPRLCCHVQTCGDCNCSGHGIPFSWGTPLSWQVLVCFFASCSPKSESPNSGGVPYMDLCDWSSNYSSWILYCNVGKSKRTEVGTSWQWNLFLWVILREDPFFAEQAQGRNLERRSYRLSNATACITSGSFMRSTLSSLDTKYEKFWHIWYLPSTGSKAPAVNFRSVSPLSFLQLCDCCTACVQILMYWFVFCNITSSGQKWA